jgi:hypothetical protein
MNNCDPPAQPRATWIERLTRIAEPVLLNCAADQLKARMPVETKEGYRAQRSAVTHLEAIGRTLGGIAPWLDVAGATAGEEQCRARLAGLARQSLENVVNPKAADHLDFTVDQQNLCDAAFLALGLSRGRLELWEKLNEPVRARLIAALETTRRFKPSGGNWLLFPAMIEAFLASAGARWRVEPIETAIKAHEGWYKGDGVYGDGADFHWDYYNSYVIHPLLIAVLDLMEPIDRRWDNVRAAVLNRARRFAAIQERHIAPDGSFPALGRSITYRCGAFHHLATMALRRDLPADLTPAQVRGALGCVIDRTLDAPGTFDANGWLRVGLAGHQPLLAESYISTGSLYLCTFAFLPLGLTPTDEFWTAPAAEWTSCKLWSGLDSAPDAPMSESGTKRTSRMSALMSAFRGKADDL